MVLLQKLLQFRPNILGSCLASSMALHLGILGTIYAGKISSSSSSSSPRPIPISWITIAPDAETNDQENHFSSPSSFNSFSDAFASGEEINTTERVEPEGINLSKKQKDKFSSQESNHNKNQDQTSQSESLNAGSELDSDPTLKAPIVNNNSFEESNSNLSDSTSLKSSSQSQNQSPGQSPESHAQDDRSVASAVGNSHGSLPSSQDRGSSRGTEKTGESKGASSDRQGSGASTPVIRPAPTPVPTPMPTPVPTPPPAPEVFQCVACPRPAYPSEARRSAHSGSVQVIVDVSPSGAVLSAALGSSSGSPDLDQAAMSTVQTWQFTPTADGRWGVPVYVDFQLVE